MQKLEIVESNEILYNFILLPYKPIELSEHRIIREIISKSGISVNVSGNAEKLRISNLLFLSISNCAIYKPFMELINDLRNEIGINQTVWGIKNCFGKIEWEIYFYRHMQQNRIKVNNLIQIIKRYFHVDMLSVDEELPYTMFSFDITENMKIESVNVYFSKFFGESFHTLSYKLTRSDTVFENHYEIFTKGNYHEIPERIINSPFFSSRIPVSEVFPSELLNCCSIHFATKRNKNGIYYQGINIKQFLDFLRKFNYPHELVKLVEVNRKRLNYILFDIGFDYTAIDNKLVINKSGFYGTF